MKHEWRKSEKRFYLPKTKPEKINIPKLKFFTISGQGNPNNQDFENYVQVLYSFAYPLKMGLKKNPVLNNYTDYTVYPLEGVWDLNEQAKLTYNGTVSKDDFAYKLMIRQPDFLTSEYVEEFMYIQEQKNKTDLVEKIKFEQIEEGECIQMLHIGSYDDEVRSFNEMEEFAAKNNLKRLSKKHREIYLSDPRKTTIEKLKTVLRFKVS